MEEEFVEENAVEVEKSQRPLISLSQNQGPVFVKKKSTSFLYFLAFLYINTSGLKLIVNRVFLLLV